MYVSHLTFTPILVMVSFFGILFFVGRESGARCNVPFLLMEKGLNVTTF